MSDVIELRVPLPPVMLRSNGRAHYYKRNKAADTYSLLVFASVTRQVVPAAQRWKKARVTYTWCHAGVPPDHGNLGGNTKALQDVLCVAPAGSAGKNRWYLGFVEDDKGITAEYATKKVTKDEECVLVRIEKR